MSEIKSVEDLEVFKKAHALTMKIYVLTNKFPSEEKFGLISQMRRAGASICANLMEGSYRLNRKEFRQFVGIAKGSIGELKYHLILAHDLKYLSTDEFNLLKKEVGEISRMLHGLAEKLAHANSDTKH